MKRKNTVPVVFFGEKYKITGNPKIANRVLRLFQEHLETVRRKSGEISTHRLTLLTGLALAEELARREADELKREALIQKLRAEIKDLINNLNKSGALK